MTAPRNPARRRGVAVLAAAVLALCLAGCGNEQPVRSRMSDQGPTASKTPAAQPSAAGRFAGDGHLATQDKPTTTRRGLTVTPVARYTGRVAISRREGFLAVAVGGPEELELRISRHGDPPTKAAGAGPIPVWASIHVGVDSDARPVVAYPRCSGPELGSCDLYVWSQATGREQRVAGASKAGVAETEGVVDVGDVLFTVERDPQATQDDLRFRQYRSPPGLMLSQDGGPVRQVSAEGGRGLALSGNTLADLQGSCGERVRLLDERGAERFHFASHCGFNEPVDTVGASLEQGAFFFALAKLDDSMFVYRVPLGSLQRTSVESASIGIPAVDWAASGPTSGYATVGHTCAGRFEADLDRRACLLVEVTGIELSRPAR